MRSLYRLLLVSIVSVPALSQIDTTRKEFFPLHIGDLWQYRTEDNFLLTGRVMRDTLIDGKLYYLFPRPLLTAGSGITRIDSLMRVQNRRGLPTAGDSCGGNTPYELSIYHLGEPVGAFWPICDNVWVYLTRYPLARFNEIFLMNVFGQAREVMRFDFGAPNPEPPPDTIWGFGALLARGIGVLHEQSFEHDYRILQGCIIDSVQYGTIIGVDEIPGTRPESSALEQNFPNPFNPITTIAYELAKFSHVQLKVYDMLGQEIATLVAEYQAPGRYQTTFDASVLSSGVYFYRLIADQSIFVRKMALTK